MLQRGVPESKAGSAGPWWTTAIQEVFKHFYCIKYLVFMSCWSSHMSYQSWQYLDLEGLLIWFKTITFSSICSKLGASLLVVLCHILIVIAFRDFGFDGRSLVASVELIYIIYRHDRTYYYIFVHVCIIRSLTCVWHIFYVCDACISITLLK